MDKAKALHAFWSSFGWDAIDEQSAYDEGTMEELGIPDHFITYEVSTANVLGSVDLTASLWHRSPSWATVSQKADQIAAYIGYGGRMLAVADGYIWIKLGNPFSQRMPNEENYDFRRLLLNINVDFLTAV